MSKARSERGVLVAALLAGALAGCEALIGADFDVEPAPTGEGGAGGATAGSTSTTGASTTSATTTSVSSGGGEGGGSTSTGAGGCPTDADSIAEGERRPWDVVVDDEFVYWTIPGTDGTDGEIRRRRKDASDDVEVLTSGQAQPNRLVIAGPWLYWTATGIGEADGAVRFLDRSTTAPVLTAADGLAIPIGLATDGASVYFVDRLDVDVDGEPHMRASRAGLGETTFEPFAAVPRFPTLIAVGEGVLFGGSLESNDTSVLWTVPLDGSQPVASRANETAPRPDAGITFGGGAFAVTSVAEGTFDLYNQYGNPVRAGEPNTFGAPADIAFSDGWFYFAEFGGGTIWRMSTTSAAPQCVVTGQPAVNGVAADGERVYFTLHSEGGAVRSVPLPP